MTHWLVILINTVAPFETKRVIVQADTVVEALDEKNHDHPSYYARSAQFHSLENVKHA